MKKVGLKNAKLQLNRETLRNLEQLALQNVGGLAPTLFTYNGCVSIGCTTQETACRTDCTC